jgi:hypothetical protein
VTAHTRPRPIRVAFLVDENEHWAVMLDAIFADCYSRWGGRFNLIVPCENGAPRPAYLPWLEAYDPDILYSYVDLSDAVIADLHERFSPSFLVRHKFYEAGRDRHAHRPELPMPGLSALSTCLLAVYGDPITGRRPIQLVDNHPGYPLPQFLEANFGSYNLCNQSWPISKAMADCCTQRRMVKPSQTSRTIWRASQNNATSSALRSYPLGIAPALNWMTGDGARR